MAIERILAEARSRIRRYMPAEAAAADVLIVDLRSSAASLVDLGFADAGDVEGGFEAWAAAGLPVVAAPTPGGVPGMGAPQ